MQQNFFDWSEQRFNQLKIEQIETDQQLIKTTNPPPSFIRMVQVEDELNRLRRFRESLLPPVKG